MASTSDIVLPSPASPTPLEYLLSVMRDTKASTALRVDAAIAALPYCHERLARSDPDDDLEDYE